MCNVSKRLIFLVSIILLCYFDSFANYQKSNADSSVINLGNDTSICEGSSIVLSADSGYYKYIWSTGDTVNSIIVSDSGYYIVNVLDDSLQSIGADTIRVRINKLPDASFSHQYAWDSTLFIQFFGVQAPGNLYFWDFGDGGKSILLNPRHRFETPGTYIVKLIVKNFHTDCSDSTSQQVMNHILFTDNNSLINFNNLSIYPNPFQKSTTICYELFKNEQKVSIEIYDILGRKIKTLMNNESRVIGKYEIPLELTNQSGMMIIRLLVDNQLSTYKILSVD